MLQYSSMYCSEFSFVTADTSDMLARITLAHIPYRFMKSSPTQ